MFPWFAVARQLVGLSEIAGSDDNPKIIEMYRLCGQPQTSDEIAWCAAYVGACLSLAGYRNTGSLLARSYLKYGRKIDQPREGCIAVFSRTKDPALGHVGFYVSETKNNILVLGGNQSDRVSEQTQPRERLLGYFLPSEQDIAPLPATVHLPTILDVNETLAPLHLHKAADIASVPVRGAIVSTKPLTAMPSPGADAHFLRIHAPVEKWEGGFVDHPSDPGGTTNMGITIGTLSQWRGQPVTKQDVRNLTQDEARRIFRAWYFDKVGADRMPAPAALAVYNSAVLSGPARAVRWLQQTLNALGQNVDVDGEIGPQTLGAVGRIDPRTLSAGYFQQFETFLRGLKNFAVFGDGWLSRLNDMRDIAAALPVEIPQTQPLPDIIMTTPADTQSRQILIALLIALLKARAEGKQGGDLIGAVLSALTPKADAAAGADAKTLTPVNGALGETIGKAIDGRKTGIGVIGLLATSVLPAIFPEFAANLGMSGGATGGQGGTVWASIFSALTAWGVLGKAEKWVKDTK